MIIAGHLISNMRACGIIVKCTNLSVMIQIRQEEDRGYAWLCMKDNGFPWNAWMTVDIHPVELFLDMSVKASNFKRREDPGAGEESLETTVQMRDDQQFTVIFKMADGGSMTWILDVDVFGPSIPRKMNVEGNNILKEVFY
ncbi:uncharacterized protein LOC144659721 isoform X2 [Oculina patagonica]